MKGKDNIEIMWPWYYSRLNLFLLTPKWLKKLANFEVLIEVVIYFKYRKTEERYLIDKYLSNQIVKKALPIEEALYLDYDFFLFDNTTSYTIYILDASQVMYMN